MTLRTAIRVSWDDPNSIEDGHRVYRSTDPIDPDNLPPLLAQIPAGQNWYLDEDVVPGTTYHYAVAVYLASIQQLALITPNIEAVAGIHVEKLRLSLGNGFQTVDQCLDVGSGDLLLI